MIASIANFILRSAHADPESPPPTVGHNWTNRFLKRYPEYNIRISKTLAFDRSYAHDPDNIEKWYSDFRRTIALFGVAWEDIWNFDETGFSIGVGGTQKIVTRVKNRAQKIYHPDPEVR
jgi:Tc5 transposase DNA-binding domain